LCLLFYQGENALLSTSKFASCYSTNHSLFRTFLFRRERHCCLSPLIPFGLCPFIERLPVWSAVPTESLFFSLFVRPAGTSSYTSRHSIPLRRMSIIFPLKTYDSFGRQFPMLVPPHHEIESAPTPFFSPHVFGRAGLLSGLSPPLQLFLHDDGFPAFRLKDLSFSAARYRLQVLSPSTLGKPYSFPEYCSFNLYFFLILLCVSRSPELWNITRKAYTPYC